MSASISDRAIGDSSVKPRRVACPSCTATFDLDKIGKPRSIEQHRRFFAVCNAAFLHWPEDHDRQFSDAEDARKWLTMKAGYRRLAAQIPITNVKPEIAVMLCESAMRAAGAHAVAVFHKGNICIWAPRSIRFDKMSHLEFCKLNDDVADVVKAEIGITADELLSNGDGA
jgi:hypothetical protein